MFGNINLDVEIQADPQSNMHFLTSVEYCPRCNLVNIKFQKKRDFENESLELNYIALTNIFSVI